MSIMGRVMLECDTKGCHGSETIEAEDFDAKDIKRSLTVTASFSGWVMDDDGELHCPQCCEEGREPDEDDGRTYADPGDEREDRL
jgi:hypothetical protein